MKKIIHNSSSSSFLLKFIISLLFLLPTGASFAQKNFAEIRDNIEVNVSFDEGEKKVKLFKGEIFEVGDNNFISIGQGELKLESKNIKAANLNSEHTDIVSQKYDFVKKIDDNIVFDFSTIDNLVRVYNDFEQVLLLDNERKFTKKASGLTDIFRVNMKGVPTLVYEKDKLGQESTSGLKASKDSSASLSGNDSAIIDKSKFGAKINPENKGYEATGGLNTLKDSLALAKEVSYLTAIKKKLNFLLPLTIASSALLLGFLGWFYVYSRKMKRSVGIIQSKVEKMAQELSTDERPKGSEKTEGGHDPQIDEKAKLEQELEDKKIEQEQLQEKLSAVTAMANELKINKIPSVKIQNHQVFSEPFISFKEKTDAAYQKVKEFETMVNETEPFSRESALIAKMLNKFHLANENKVRNHWVTAMQRIYKMGIITDEKVLEIISHVKEEDQVEQVKKHYYIEYLKEFVSNIFILLEEMRSLGNFIPSDTVAIDSFCNDAELKFGAQINELQSHTKSLLNLQVYYVPIGEKLRENSKNTKAVENPATYFYKAIYDKYKAKEKEDNENYIIEVMSYGVKSEDIDKTTTQVIV